MTSFIDDLIADGLELNNLSKTSNHSTPKATKVRETFSCESCRGTGFYQGTRVHQEKSECFACKGKGFFYTSKFDRQKAAAKRRASKANALEVAQDSFKSEFPGLIEAMLPLAAWNNFVADLLRQFNERGTLSSNQVAAAQRQIDKAAQRDAERAAAKAKADAGAPVVDLAVVRNMFETAKSNGLKKPGLWFGDIKISEAPATGQNAGALYVKLNGEYAGKIVGSKFKVAWGANEEKILPELLAIAANPTEVLRIKGKETNKCCCCGRELSDPASVAAGIGPICASNWGL